MACGAGDNPRRLLAFVFTIAAAVTAVLSLDATVVLLTPVVFATAAWMRTSRFPFHAEVAESFELGSPRDEVDRHAALLQGVAFIERLWFDCIDGLGAPVQEPLRLRGGASRSRY